ncbi:MAG: hypothetical protein AAGF55_10055 [Pseudomonadota bacterium]
MNVIVAGCVLFLSLIFWLPIYGTLYYDGFAKVLDWPTMFYWFLAIALVLTGFALWLLRTKPAGAEAVFHEGGFTLNVQQLLQKRRYHRLNWRDIEEVKLVEAPRGGDFIAFRLRVEAAVREGLIQPTTREDAAKALVRREVNFPVKLSKVGPKDAAARFKASAEQAGASLVEQTSFNVVVFARIIWSVEWPEA